MKILILEDNSIRMKYFNILFENQTIHHAEHSDDAINFLKNNEYDLICLDHDLGGTQINYDPTDNGTIVAKYIHDHPVDCQVIIHSCNENAVYRMLNLIPGSKYINDIYLNYELVGNKLVEKNKYPTT